MSTTLSATVKAGVSWDFENVIADPGNTVNAQAFSYTRSFSNGTGLNNCDLIYFSTGTINASSSLTLDIFGGLNDVFGNVISMARFKAMYINLTTDTSAVSALVGNATNPVINWVGAGTHTIRIRNGGVFMICAPDATAYAVTAATADQIKIANEDGSNTATYKVCILGASA